MMFVNFDLARALLEERRAESLTHSMRRRARAQSPRRRPEKRSEAEVVELVFGRQCDTDQIGA